MKHSLYVSAILVGIGSAFWQGVACQHASAAIIAVANYGFEDLDVGMDPGVGAWIGEIPSWSRSGPSGNASDAAASTFRPGSDQFPDGVPQGIQVAAVGSLNYPSAIWQDLPHALLEAGTIYTLQVDVGRRMDYGGVLYPYTIELIAGGITLASGSSLEPEAGKFLTDTITYNSGSNPTQLGEMLTIRLSTTEGQVDFDNVRLDAMAIPEPASFAVWSLLGGAGIVAAVRSRRRNAT